jgi:hypothetical protein
MKQPQTEIGSYRANLKAHIYRIEIVRVFLQSR